MQFSLQKILAGVVLWSISLSHTASAEAVLVRDLEVEYLVRAAIEPILINSDMDSESLSVLIVDDSRLNAFAGNNSIGVFTGVIEKGTSEMLLGVLAHEVGHLVYGDLVFQSEYVSSSLKKYMAIMLAMSGLSIASNKGEVGMAGQLLTRHVLEREYLNFRRGEESSADIYAIDVLQRSQLTSKGLIQFFQMYMKRNSELSEANQYLMTHELPEVRLDKLEEKAKESPYYNSPLPEEIEFAFAMSRAKIMGSFRDEKTVLSFYREPRDEKYFNSEKRYAKVAMYSGRGLNDRAMEELEYLIEGYPDYPFFHSTKASILQRMKRGE